MVNVSTFSEVGGHLLNEDAFAVVKHPLDEKLTIGFIADGQGGRAGGQRAAQLACQIAVELASKFPPERLTDRKQWVAILEEVDARVQAVTEAGFTTFIGLVVKDDQIIGASSGDSAALLLTGNEAIEVTKGQLKNPPVGSGEAPAVIFTATAKNPWKLLMMTDGVWKYVGWPKLVEIARRQQGAEMIAEFQRAARLPGSGRFQDDFTIILLESELS